jgi:hypothetical protein
MAGSKNARLADLVGDEIAISYFINGQRSGLSAQGAGGSDAHVKSMARVASSLVASEIEITVPYQQRPLIRGCESTLTCYR